MLGVNNTGTGQSDRDNEVFISRMSCPCLTSDPTCSFNDRPSPLSLRMIDCCTGTPRALIGRERRQEEVGEVVPVCRPRDICPTITHIRTPTHTPIHTHTHTHTPTHTFSPFSLFTRSLSISLRLARSSFLSQA